MISYFYMKTLSIDFGTKKIGLAISDNKGIIAAPLKVIYRKSDQQIISELNELITDHKIEQVVVGIPRSLYDKPTIQEKRCRNFADKLKSALDIPVLEWDETFSTKYAESKNPPQYSKSRHGRYKNDVDAKAAAIILQEFLDSPKK